MGGAATDAKPLIPHAQGTRDDLAPEIRLIPLGKGIPIRNASGDTRRIVTTIRAPVGHAAAAANRSGSTKVYTTPRAQIPAMDVAIMFPAKRKS